jgi:hypothetical protein
MNDFLNSLKSDLLDRRLIPVLGLLAVVLVAAIAYAAFAGGSSSPAPSATGAAAPSVKAPGVAVSQVKTADVVSSAETTSGSAHQTNGSSRNPFAAQPSVKRAQAASAAAAKAALASGSASSSGAESGSGSSSSGGTTSTPAEEAKPSTPAKPKAKQTVYHVAVVFGVISPDATAQAPLTPFEDLKREQPLPSDSQPLVVFRGVLAGAKSATFTLVGEAILRGDAKCLPSASQCQAIDLQPGQSEELEYAPPGAAAVTYKLQVVSIKSSKATASAARSAFGGKSKTGLALLRGAGLVRLPGLRYSATKGVLVFAGQHAFGARAHVSVARAHASAWGWSLKG